MRPHNAFLILAATSSAALASCDDGGPDVPLENTSWVVVAIEERDSTFTPPEGADTPRFDLSDEIVQDGVRRRITGSLGCNLLAGSFKASLPDSLRISALANTGKSCPEPIEHFEIRLTRVLADVTRFERDGSTLLMESPEGLIRLSSAEADEPSS